MDILQELNDIENLFEEVKSFYPIETNKTLPANSRVNMDMSGEKVKNLAILLSKLENILPSLKETYE